MPTMFRIKRNSSIYYVRLIGAGTRIPQEPKLFSSNEISSREERQLITDQQIINLI